jgi:hypothetical protein
VLAHSSSNCTWISSNSSIKRSCSFLPCIPLRHNLVRIVISRTPNTSSRAEASYPKANNDTIFSTSPECVFNRYKMVFLRLVNFLQQAWHFRSRIFSCFPWQPYPTRA